VVVWASHPWAESASPTGLLDCRPPLQHGWDGRWHFRSASSARLMTSTSCSYRGMDIDTSCQIYRSVFARLDADLPRPCAASPALPSSSAAQPFAESPGSSWRPHVDCARIYLIIDALVITRSPLGQDAHPQHSPCPACHPSPEVRLGAHAAYQSQVQPLSSYEHRRCSPGS